MALALAAAVLSSRLAGQSEPRAQLAGPSFALTMNRLDLGSDPPTSEFMIRFTRLRPSALSLDLALGVVDVSGAAAIALEVGPASTLACPGGALLFRVGVMGLQAPSGTAGGLYAGLSALLKFRGRSGLRVDVARQQYLRPGRSLGAWQFGGGMALLPRVR
jgi:hypothetical protein